MAHAVCESLKSLGTYRFLFRKENVFPSASRPLPESSERRRTLEPGCFGGVGESCLWRCSAFDGASGRRSDCRDSFLGTGLRGGSGGCVVGGGRGGGGRRCVAHRGVKV